MRIKGPTDSNGIKKNKNPSHLKYSVIANNHALFVLSFAATAAKEAVVKMTRAKSNAFQKSRRYLELRKRENQLLPVAAWRTAAAVFLRAEATAW